jgi:nucleoside diphosphate kinase
MKTLYQFIKEYLSTPENCKAFIIIKPGFLDYQDEIFKYCNDKGFIMHDHTEPMKLTDKQIQDLYGCHSKEDWYDDLCKYMASGNIVAAEYMFDYDKYPGTNTISLMKDIKHHFRDKYGKSEMKNCMHSSDSLEHVQKEGKIIFN